MISGLIIIGLGCLLGCFGEIVGMVGLADAISIYLFLLTFIATILVIATILAIIFWFFRVKISKNY